MSKESSDIKKKLSPAKPLDYYPYIIENSQDILYLIDAETGKFEYVSPAATAITGFTPMELAEMGADGISGRTHPDTQETVEELKGILAKKVRFLVLPSLELKFKHKAGHYIWLGVNRNLITKGNGKIEAIVGSIRDITEIKRLQQQLEISLENYKTLYHNAPAALYRTRISDGKMLECNETMAKLLGYESREQCLAEHYSAKYYTDCQRRSELMELLKENGQVDGFELETRRVDGSVLWMRVSVQAYPEKGYLEGTIYDITASKFLTSAENQILEQIMLGKSSKEIAFQLKRSVRTIEDHRAHIMQKLGARNLVELTKKTIQAGIEPQ